MSSSETERDLQTSNRFELQNESQKTVSQEFSIEAGVNTSGRYGVTKVETSLDAGLQGSASESRSSSLRVAKDIVSRAVERTQESVRQLRRRTVTAEIRELNAHEVSNKSGDESPEPSFSGLYFWVEKIHEVELRHYGKRLMIEFHIPEPGLSLLRQQGDPPVDVRKPAPLRIGPQDISPANYLCLTKLYGAHDVEPPPAQFLNVGYSWGSTSEESAEGDAEETATAEITIPKDYRPHSGTAVCKSRYHENLMTMFVAVGGIVVIDENATTGVGPKSFQFATWDNATTVPIVIRVARHFDKTAVVQVNVRCERTSEAMANWSLRTYESIREAHSVLVGDYERALERARFTENDTLQIGGRPSTVNRNIERDELKKWAIKTMRIKPFEFDAVIQEGEHQEIDPVVSDEQAPVIRFYEEAFEWREMAYFLYPYFWSRPETWELRQGTTDPSDPRHEAFLRAGASRLIVPVTPGYEKRVFTYLQSNSNLPESERIRGPGSNAEINETGEGSALEELWVELLLQHNEEAALGSGSLHVTNESEVVAINDDSTWLPSERDLGRELFIDGGSYQVASVDGERTIILDRPYDGPNDDKARYATGSVPFASPWLVRVPTNLVVLDEGRKALTL